MLSSAAWAQTQAPDAIPVEDGVLPLTLEGIQLVGTPPMARGLVRVAFPDPPLDLPVLGEIIRDTGADLLRSLYGRGLAAGNHGDLYDNRDRDHSNLRPGDFPQITYVEYGPKLRGANRDYGAATDLIFDAPLIGNSSTALTTGPFWRSQARALLTSPLGPLRLYQNYRAGQLYLYPEHRDHDPENGDVFPANTPYMIVSQGSSASDRAHMRKMVMILAAFRPDTKAFLRETGLLLPTMQMIYRRTREPVTSREVYLSGLAHPSVFDGETIHPGRAIGLANAIKPGEVPPMVVLRVLDETRPREGIDFFGQGLSERLFDTPAAIARVWRSKNGRREMVVSAAATQDPNGRALTFDWVLLRGDPERVRIEMLNEAGTEARIIVDWQDPRPAPGTPDITSHRVDIGIFANNGVHDSAPSFVSVLLPSHETRDYAVTDGGLVPKSIDRRAAAGRYADPALFPKTAWRDVYAYDAAGGLLGWTRAHGGFPGEYDPTGAGPEGRPLYLLSESGRGGQIVDPQPEGEKD